MLLRWMSSEEAGLSAETPSSTAVLGVCQWTQDRHAILAQEEGRKGVETNPEGMLLSRGAQALKSYLQDVSPLASVMSPLSLLPKASDRQLYLLVGYL